MNRVASDPQALRIDELKALALAEKPSVGRELARILGCRPQGRTHMEGDRSVVTWALGHLVTLADPDEYDAKYKTWRMEDLPMLPQQMRLKSGARAQQKYLVRKYSDQKEIKTLVNC